MKKKAKEAKQKKCERKREKEQCYYPFTTLLLQSSTKISMIESFVCCHFHILVGIFHYRTWLVYYNDGLPQNSHHTYLSWHFHSHSEIYCHATSIIIIMTYITFVILPLHDHKIASMLFSWLVRFLMSLLR